MFNNFFIENGAIYETEIWRIDIGKTCGLYLYKCWWTCINVKFSLILL